MVFVCVYVKNKWLPLQQFFKDLHIDVQKSQMVILKFFCTKTMFYVGLMMVMKIPF